MIFRKKEWPWPLENEAQAQLFSQLAEEEGIAYKIVRHGDPLFGYATQVPEGFGHVETIPGQEETMDRFYKDFIESESPEPEDTEADSPL